MRGWTGKITGRSIARPSRIARRRAGSSTFSARCRVSSTNRSSPRAASGRWSPPRASGPAVRVDHHVADQLRPGAETLAGEVLHGRLGRGEEEVGQVVGHDPVALLRHARVERAKPGLDVRQPRPPPIGDTPAWRPPGRRPGSSSCRRRRGRRPARARASPAPGGAASRRSSPRADALPTPRLTSGSGISRSRKNDALIASS